MLHLFIGSNKNNMADGRWLWFVTVLIRFCWVCIPQRGYIYPDEFFQATEITAGDVMGFKHTRTWEWLENFPVRSPVFPYIFTSIPFYFVKMVVAAGNITSRTLIVAPRLFMTVASLFIDYTVYKICQHLSMDPTPSLCLFSTSFVTLVFYTRTFSNSAEAVVFAALLLLVISSVSNRNIFRSGRDWLRTLLMGLLLTVGFWIRPTFLAFAFTPLLWWVIDIFTFNWSIEAKTFTAVKEVLKQCTLVGLGSFLMLTILTLVDSFYFGYLQKKEIVLTALNFVLYNLDTGRVKDHGLHPRITHFAVNLPLLFGPMAFAFYMMIAHTVLKRKFADYLKVLLSRRNTSKSNSLVDDYKTLFICSLLMCSIVVSIALLSWIPHQEPRFITPVLLPLVILFSWCLTASSFAPLMMLSWIIWNIIGCTMFGILHQGGVYPCMAHLQQYLHNARSQQNASVAYQVTFYHTYMPPQHLLAWPMSHEHEGDSLHSLAVLDLQGSSKDTLVKHLEKLIHKEAKMHGKKIEVR